MKTILLTYMAFGLLTNIIGPLASKMREDYDLSKPADRILSDDRFSLKSHLLLRFLVFLVYPIIYMEYLYSYWKEQKAIQPTNVVKTGLFFHQMKGSGRVSCTNCGFNQRLTVSMRNDKNANILNVQGSQCQNCGRFKEVSSAQSAFSTVKNVSNATLTMETEGCECGGTLSRDRVVCCPRCKSENMSYECLLLT
jgi:DNA-directed RNA polymerase subunit M/transcription elongation factor TFIIS